MVDFYHICFTVCLGNYNLHPLHGDDHFFFLHEAALKKGCFFISTKLNKGVRE